MKSRMLQISFALVLSLLIYAFVVPAKGPTPYIIPLPSHVPYPEIPADNPLTVEGVLLGRHLFYDPVLSVDGTISCSSCHKQEFAFSDTARFSVGVGGNRSKRNSMSLVNLAWGRRFFWDGRVGSLEELVHHPVTDAFEMGEDTNRVAEKLCNSSKYRDLFARAFPKQKITFRLAAYSIAQFMRTIVSFNSPMDVFVNGMYTRLDDTPYDETFKQFAREHLEETHGLVSEICSQCHGGYLYGGVFMRNNGLGGKTPEEGFKSTSGLLTDLGKFKAPVIRNLSYTYPYMHDGSLRTLEEVMDHYQFLPEEAENLAPELKNARDRLRNITPEQKQHLLKMLEYMNDPGLLTNPAYSKP